MVGSPCHHWSSSPFAGQALLIEGNGSPGMDISEDPQKHTSLTLGLSKAKVSQSRADVSVLPLCPRTSKGTCVCPDMSPHVPPSYLLLLVARGQVKAEPESCSA